MTLEITIRPETPNDYTTIARVNDLAFARPDEGKLVENLRQLPEFDPHLSLVAELDDEVIGHALFLQINIQSDDGKKCPILSLGPIAVMPKFQKQGIGGRLIEAGHRAALELDYTSVVLLGHPGYYPRFGYKLAKIWGLTNPWSIHGEPWMAIELVKDALKGKTGLVAYPEAFNDAV